MTDITDEMKVDAITKTANSPAGGQVLLVTLRSSARATENVHAQFLESMRNPLVKEAIERRKKLGPRFPGGVMKVFLTVAKSELLTGYGASQVLIFMRAVREEMSMVEDDIRSLEEALENLRRRFPKETSEEVIVPLEVMES